MASGNKTLGRFILDGIPPAPRGIPQIEVTFDIDANGIVHVSAKDTGTGKEQKITITASTNLTEREIQEAVKEAQKFADEDKKRKQLIEATNNADSLIYNTEKTLKDLGDKVEQADKDKILADIDSVKKVLETKDAEKIDQACEKLSLVTYEVFGKIYQKQGGQPGASHTQSAGGSQDEKVVDNDYEVVDDDK